MEKPQCCSISRSRSSSPPSIRNIWLSLIHIYQVAVYRYGETEKPLSILDVYLHNLPEYDQNRLKDGVPAENGEALQRLIEDYTS